METPKDTQEEADLKNYNTTTKCINTDFFSFIYYAYRQSRKRTHVSGGLLGTLASVANFKVVNIEPRLAVTCRRRDLQLRH